METSPSERRVNTICARRAAAAVTLALATLLAGLGCSSNGRDEGPRELPAAPGDATRPFATPPSSTQAPSAGGCDTLTRRQCLAAKHCRLTGKSPEYVCRPSVGPCENGFDQTDKAACEAAGCSFQPARCYCPCRNNGSTKAGDADGEGCSCACGGGPPPSCSPQSAGKPDRPSR
jgi:hypothetical protein